MGGEKVACWSTKVTISLKRVKIEEKLLWRAYRNSPTLFTIPDALRPHLPQDWGLQPPPKTSITYLRNGKATDFRFGRYIHRVHLNKSPLDIFGEMGVWRAYPGTGQIFGVPLLSQKGVKLQTSKFVRTFIGSFGTKAH